MNKLFYITFFILTSCGTNENNNKDFANLKSENEKLKKELETLKNLDPKKDSVLYYNNYYGKVISEDSLNSIDTKSLSNEEGLYCKLSGKITEVGYNGEYMSLEIDYREVFVKFSDFSFFVPNYDIIGKRAIIQGDLFLDTVSVEMLKHYAEDAGKTEKEIAQITEPSYKLGFTADGVIIKNRLTNKQNHISNSVGDYFEFENFFGPWEVFKMRIPGGFSFKGQGDKESTFAVFEKSKDENIIFQNLLYDESTYSKTSKMSRKEIGRMIKQNMESHLSKYPKEQSLFYEVCGNPTSISNIRNESQKLSYISVQLFFQKGYINISFTSPNIFLKNDIIFVKEILNSLNLYSTN